MHGRRALNSITAHFDSSVVLRRKQIFSVLCGLHKQAGASSGSNSGFVVRLSQWSHSEKFQMSASCLGWYNVTLCPIVHFVNTLQTPPFDIHWSLHYGKLREIMRTFISGVQRSSFVDIFGIFDQVLRVLDICFTQFPLRKVLGAIGSGNTRKGLWRTCGWCPPCFP